MPREILFANPINTPQERQPNQEELCKKFGAPVERVAGEFKEQAINLAQEVIEKIIAVSKMEINDETKTGIIKKLAEGYINNEDRLLSIRSGLETAATSSPNVDMNKTETIVAKNQLNEFRKYLQTIKLGDIEKLMNAN